MAKICPKKFLLFIIPLLVFIGACAQSPEPTTTPTPVPQPTQTPAPVEKQVVILYSQVIVENFAVSDPDPETGEIEVLVQGSVSNTCTEVDGVSISQDGQVFSVQVEASFTSGPDCEEKTTRFEEVVVVDGRNLEPGAYLVASGVVKGFEIGTDQPTGTDSSAGGDATKEVEAIPEETETAETPTPTEEPTPTEPRECQDMAVFVADTTYPDNTEVTAGTAFTKTWEIRNEGDCTWGPGYELEFVSGTFEQVESLEDPFPAVAPSESVDLSALITAPDTAGTHSGTWIIKRPEGDSVQTQDGQAFDFWAVVVVPGSGTGFVNPVPQATSTVGVVCAEAKPNYESELLGLINETRAANSLPPYELQDQLSKAAQVMTIDNSCNNSSDHIDSDGLDWFGRIAAQGYAYEDAAENLVYGYGLVPELALSWWMNSQVHRGNILNASLTQIGIAYALNPQTEVSNYTLVFASPE